jgi:hypothetical protein
MQHTQKIRHIAAFILLTAFLTLTACQPVPTQPTAADSQKSETTAPSQPAQTEASESLIEGSTQETSETQSPDPTPTPTPAPTLSDWRDAPITPESIHARVLDIYAEGQHQGRDPHSFSVIGDCQAIPYVFMGPFGRGALEPDPAESHLWNAINHFDESFDRWAVTARGGFTAASILNSLQADPEECKPGESPLTCEFRINNPAYVLVTLETWLDPDTIDRYEVYLRQILDTVIAHGAVPILLTKADSSELRDGTHVINPVIVRLAYEYQLPLVNFWRAAQYLDNYGIDPEREGFHLSEAGYKLKNVLALRALYQVWTFIEDSAGEVAEAETSPTPTVTSAVPELQISDPGCEAGDCIFFGRAQSSDGIITPAGVYAYHVNTQTLTQLLGEGYDLQDISAEGARLLVNYNHLLYVVDLIEGKADLVSDTFLHNGKQGAYWNDDESEIIFLDETTPLQTDAGDAFNLFPYPKGDTLYFEAGACSGKDFCQSQGVYKQAAGGEPEALTGVKQPVFSPDGSLIAFLNPDAAKAENYYHIPYLLMMETTGGLGTQRTLYFPAESGFEVYPEVDSYAFSPNGDMLFILYNVYSEYYERSERLQTYLWNLENGILYDFGKLEGVSALLEPRFAWSPEGDQILLFLTDLTEEGKYRVSVYLSDLTTGEKLILLDEHILTGTDYSYLTNFYWR